MIPWLYDGRNKTFWFANFEQQKEPLSAPISIFVPTEQQLRGDFSDAGRTIRDPVTNQPFPGNIIPQNRLDPLALNYLSKFVPTTSDSPGLYRYQRPADNNPTSFLFRADQLVGSRHQLSVRSFITRREGPSAAGNLPAFQASRHQRYRFRRCLPCLDGLAKQDQHRSFWLQRHLLERRTVSENVR